MVRWLRFFLFVLSAYLRLKSSISLAAKIKFPKFVVIGRRCKIRPGCFVDAPGPEAIIIGDEVNLNRNVYLGAFGGSLTIGDRTQLNRGASIDSRGAVYIGRDVLIGPGVKLIAYQHRFDDKDVPVNRQGFVLDGIRIEDDVWIGANAVILAGVTLGKGSIVGAGAVVNRSFPAFSIVAGVPARVIGERGGRHAVDDLRTSIA
jgi:galactoside O-acetyltransferase